MNRLSGTFSVVLMMLAFAVSTPVSAEWPQLDAPPGAYVEWVADDMKLNGVSMRIRRFTSKAPVAEIIAFYRHRWKDRLPPVENVVGEWTIIGKQQGDYYLTVQVKNAGRGGSEGLLGISELPVAVAGERVAVDIDFPKMAGTEVLSNVDSNDFGKHGKTLIFKNDHSVQSNASFYKSMLAVQGWKRNESYGGIRGDRHLLYFQRRDQSASIVIAPDQGEGTAIVVNIVTEDG